MEELKVIDEEYTEMALFLAAKGVPVEEIIDRVNKCKEYKEILAESRAFRHALRIKKNNRVGYVAYR